MGLNKELEHIKDSNIEFKAYSRKLLRCLEYVKTTVDSGQTEKAITLLDELIEDTKNDINDPYIDLT